MTDNTIYNLDGTVNEWCKVKGFNKDNLKGVHLIKKAYPKETNIDLMIANMRGAKVDLMGANLKGVDLTGANLATFSIIMPKDYIQIIVNLSGADLTGANLFRANLTGANLSGADLTGAYFTRAPLTEATLTNTIYDAYTVFPYRFTVVGKGMILNNTIKHTNGTDHPWCKTHGVDKTNIVDRLNELQANGVKIDLSGAVLYRAKLRRTNLMRGADLKGADLKGADLSGAELHRAELHRADLHRTNLTEADLTEADLTNADLRGANLNGATLTNAIYNSETIFPEDFGDPKLRGMIFQK